jgi:hypothetical protein
MSNAETFGYLHEYCATPGQSSLKSMKPGLYRKNRDESDPYQRTVVHGGV